MSACLSMGTYAFLEGLQCTTQIISYEIPTGLILNILLIRIGSCNFNELVIAQKANMVWHS